MLCCCCQTLLAAAADRWTTAAKASSFANNLYEATLDEEFPVLYYNAGLILVFGTLRASAAGRCTLFRALHAWHGEFAVRICMVCRRRGAAAPPTATHRPPPTAPPNANGRASLRLAAGVQTYPKTRVIPGYPGITRSGVYPVITHNNTA